MATTIRLARSGTKKKPFYHIQVTDSRNARDGRYIERLGTFNPALEEANQVTVDRESVQKWVSTGAQMSDTVRQILARSSK